MLNDDHGNGVVFEVYGCMTKSDASLVTNMNKYALLLVLFVSLVDSPCGPVCSEYLYLPLLLKPFMLMK